ncbi:Dipeptidyl aminopeptidase/acylaminoacyl-peptidase [Halapricum desulfuricans]|uniref:Dipeptidyl aminopeptidase/acylaminoacyl-peptidase n=1 Tax=Halapricum desulfuricans TaxID=2841257 RepID=A0A897N8C1_9EURY|nr:Dipeptidyl aminopeptidase/acylaminoacyl-peptidase [Halapricum desulfuricans]QSG10650.1 Dipeptidyl aminopeptidase/acylaminoacyl-peptidase [Halapricum desulfuricans]
MNLQFDLERYLNVRSAYGASLAVDGTLAFLMDTTGTAQLFRLAPDSGEVHAMTDIPEAKHRWGGWSHDGERIAFTSNRRADLYGCHVVQVEPEGTTKECARCGVATAKPIWVRDHSCPRAGFSAPPCAGNIQYRIGRTR